MLSKQKFDEIIKNNLNSVDLGYMVEGRDKPYDCYYTQESFEAFKVEMQSPKYIDAFNKYSEGKGSELKPHKIAHGMLPPKMASVASSSRFCYLALRDGGSAIGAVERPQFEYGCPIRDNNDIKLPGTAPQLDAAFPGENIFVEVKCHEIFDSHSIVMKKKYEKLLFGSESHFGFLEDDMEYTKSGEFKIKPEALGFDDETTSTMFDIKQFLCHLLGISCTKEKDKPAELVYLFFKPKTKTADEQEKVDEVFDALKAEINTLFKTVPIKKFTEFHHIKLSAVAEFAEVMVPLTEDNKEILFLTE